MEQGRIDVTLAHRLCIAAVIVDLGGWNWGHSGSGRST